MPSNNVKKHILKAYDNKEFLHSKDGRILRILSEYLYPEIKFKNYGIKKTVIFFGSARIHSKEHIDSKISMLNEKLNTIISPTQKKSIESEIESLQHKLKMSHYYDEARDLSSQLVKWSNSLNSKDKLYVASGGGPGIMEAANRGAFEAGGISIGMNISLPFEQVPNPYINDDLNMEFHYFFLRKFWLVYLAQILIVFPGGFGTIDELMEVLTLRQTKKMKRPRLVILYSEKWWRSVINFDFLIENGVISSKDMNLFKFVNTPEEAMNYIQQELTKFKFQR